MRKLTKFERETIVNFNEGESVAYVFTYNKRWQKHLEGRFGLKPVTDNGYGGKTYQLPKNRIRMPQLKRELSNEEKKVIVERLSRSHLMAKKRGVVIGKGSERPK